jgi:hypothetical protein
METVNDKFQVYSKDSNLTLDRRFMITPASNMVEIVGLTPSDALLPILECVSNSVISLDQSGLPVGERKIDIEIIRGEFEQPDMYHDDGIRPIKDVIITDNGIGFNDKNLQSFETPHSNVLRKKYGCLGVGRFTVLAAFQKMKIRSNFPVNSHWQYRELDFDAVDEVNLIVDRESDEQRCETVVEIQTFSNKTLVNKTAVSVEAIAEEMMKHFLVFYLCDNLPNITVRESDSEVKQNLNELYKVVEKENVRDFEVSGQNFRLYITRNPKTTSRRHHYVRYCADSRVIGRGKRLGLLDSIFNYPLTDKANETYLDVFVVSEFLNANKMPTRNAWRINATPEDSLFEQEITFQDIEQELVKILRDEYSDHVKHTQQRNIAEWKQYIATSPRFNSIAQDEDILRGLPVNTPDDKKEEFLHRLIHKRQKKIAETIQEFIDKKQVNEETIQRVISDLRSTTILNRDSLVDYMLRRRAVIDVFEAFLEADEKGEYKLEGDVHSLIFPERTTSDEMPYEAHNLWLLDERLVSYQFIASNKTLSSHSNIASIQAPDILAIDTQQRSEMFDNPIAFGDTNYGDISSLVIFEFKRPGETAHNKKKGDYLWEFSDLTDKYFDTFVYGKRKTNSKGRSLNISSTTPKFGYIVMDVIPAELERYNLDHGWKKTPFGTYYKITGENNMHLEAMTFNILIDSAKKRHSPFFDRLFVQNNSTTA